ncbi:2-keto-4-pentenoate hydratase/2-oxohepta-3-ene-1,7-dioic acid hydratase in catechol pathway [Bradyrhizobium sp. cir1]|uniref:fumarylacetoacetate hydrolase family protein n=1 Tax=Bradyrhizobium sp. cir1 TaxID=1445730 RepID=UPI001812DEA8|nr:fumarylacetoacetate hydrolase family protein [Bradyrhizobium sp. cir1]MBB4368371.1 2-keto-4-pentenoate hydratase/2-oxohepta-3-ene-1,7-dioic acid hydratase in catechol pathway [Bradyrhizobium sp. cir1]
MQMPRGLTLLSLVQVDGRETLGVKLSSGILDVALAGKTLNLVVPTTLEELLARGDAAALERLIAAAKDKPEFLKDEATIKFGRLFASPGKIVCVGLNYKAHAEEAGEKLPKIPILFNKYNNTLAAHNCTIKLPPREVSHKFDYETELLVVIGKTARNVSEAEALDYVAGYAVGHDFSARDLQLETGGQWMVGKTLDGFAPIGPYFVSADLVDPNNLAIETFVNDEAQPRQSSHTSKFIFNPQKVISYASKLFALEPGDIIFTGTPEGVIIGMPKEKQVWLKAGDRITSRIEKLGTLKFDLA